MRTADRVRRIREAERAVGKLVEKGWRLECIEYQDEADEPFRATVHIAVNGESGADKPL